MAAFGPLPTSLFVRFRKVNGHRPARAPVPLAATAVRRRGPKYHRKTPIHALNSQRKLAQAIFLDLS